MADGEQWRKTILDMLNLKCLLDIQGEISVSNWIYIYSLHGGPDESEIEIEIGIWKSSS